MKINLSSKLRNVEASVTLSITAKAKEMISEGIDVVSFGAGEPDFDTPEYIRKAGISSIIEGKTRYTSASGIEELKKTICNKFDKDNNLKYNSENIIVSNGAKHSIYNALCTILNPGDEVILACPYWVSYPELIKLAGGVPILINTSEKNGFKYSVDELNKVKTNKTKAIFLNSPNNPTGAVYSVEELNNIAEWSVNNNILVLSDEIYEKLIYDGNKHISIASINDEIKELTIVINGMSKAYAMTGWRIGYVAANKEIVRIMSNFQSHTASNPCSISQYASVCALKGNQNTIHEMRVQFEKRRNYMVDTINSIKGLSCIKPGGAFYVMVNISKIKGLVKHGIKINTSVDFANILLEKSKVAVIPGLGFGNDDYVRLSYATSMDDIKLGLERIKEFLDK